MTNKNQVLRIHHVTAICSNPQKNIDFYTKLLRLRLVKLTVNFDPTTYHLYYGDEIGHPGTILTFFPWPIKKMLEIERHSLYIMLLKE
jgi:glyoxalase family protein